MTLIHVALIGLSVSASTSWAETGHLPYLLSPRGKAKYEIVALLNSSVSSAEAARSHFNFPTSVKAYGSPDDLAADPNVDLVVCCTRVDVHLPTVLPSLKVGKACFVEWPLASNLNDARMLAAEAKLAKSVIGLQCRVSPPVLALQSLLSKEVIGKVLSSDVRAFTTIRPAAELEEGLAYFADRKIGGSPMTIALGHMIDFVHLVLGEFVTSSWRSQIQRPQITITGNDGKVTRTVKSDVPDLVAVHGELAGREYLRRGASLSVTMRNGNAFPGDPGFVWTINGEKGEIKITNPAGPYWQFDFNEAIKIEVHDHATGEVKEEKWEWEAWAKELPVQARSVAELYERYVTKDLLEKKFPEFSDAVIRHAELQDMFDSWDRQLAR